MLAELFQQEQKCIQYFFDQVDLKEAEEILQILNACEGVMIFSGVGKSGLIAKKIAVTMTSIGIKAIYLSPTNALHGDLGIVNEKDVFIMISKSGESEELLNLIPALRNKRVKIITLVSNPTSRLAKSSDNVMPLPLDQELCPFNMVPTTSTTIQMIFGDVMAIALMKLRNFSLDEYAINHPAGRIGKRITTRVRDLMLTDGDIPLCRPQDKLVDTLVELSNKRCGCVMIVDDEHHLLGIFTDGDLRRSLQKKGPQALESEMEHLMTPTGRTIRSEVLAWDAMKAMESDQKNPITALPVVDEHRCVVGLIKMHDIVQSGV